MLSPTELYVNKLLCDIMRYIKDVVKSNQHIYNMKFKKNINTFLRTRYRLFAGIPFLIFLLVNPSSLKAFQADSTGAINISLSAVIERVETPLNVPVTMTVILSWEGKTDRYRIGPFENPVLTNLEVVGSRSSARSELRDGKVFAVKEFTFSLQPVELGMGYIDGIIIEYTDTMTGAKDYLITQRMSVKGLPPEYTKDYSLLLTGIGLLAVAGFIIVLIFFMRRRRQERKVIEIQPDLIENTIIERLKNVHSQNNLSFSQKLDEVVAEFRHFLIKKFDIPQDRKSDALIIETISESGVEESIIAKIHTIFEQAEQVRFSGKDIKNDDFELIYGAVESCVELCVKFQSNKESDNR